MATGPIIVLTLLTTEEIQRALALTERGGVLPNGEVRCPEAFRRATPAEWEVLERWTKLCGEPLDHLGLAEELVDRIGEAERRLAEEVAALLAQAKQVDAAEDAQYGKGRRGNELPAELAHRESRLAKLREAKAVLEAEARAEATEAAAQAKLAERKAEGTGRQPAGRPPAGAVPGPRHAQAVAAIDLSVAPDRQRHGGAAGHAVYAPRKTAWSRCSNRSRTPGASATSRSAACQGAGGVVPDLPHHNLLKLFRVGWTPLGQVVTETDIDGQCSDVLGCAEAAVAAAVRVVGGGKAIARVIADRLFGQADVAAQACLQRLADHGCHHGPLGGDVLDALPQPVGEQLLAELEHFL